MNSTKRKLSFTETDDDIIKKNRSKLNIDV